VGSRGRLARRALSEVSSGRSAVKVTSRSRWPPMARTVAPMADLNSWVWSGLLALLRGDCAMRMLVGPGEGPLTRRCAAPAPPRERLEAPDPLHLSLGGEGGTSGRVRGPSIYAVTARLAELSG